MEYFAGAEKKLRNIETVSPFSALCKQDERKKHKLGSAVVAKGVSSPSLGLWLLICLFSNKSAATWPRFCIVKAFVRLDFSTVRPRTLISKTNTAEISRMARLVGGATKANRNFLGKSMPNFPQLLFPASLKKLLWSPQMASI